MAEIDYSPYLDRLQTDLELRASSPKTIRGYRYAVIKFLRYANKPVDELTVDDVRNYIIFMQRNGLDKSTINMYISSIRFFFAVSLRRPLNDYEVPRLRKDKKLPIVLSRDEIKALLNCCDDIRFKALFALTYGSGLRISEVMSLKVSDINSKDMTVFVRNSKRNKDRITVLSKQSLLLLREYWKTARPKQENNDFLFPGGARDGRLSAKFVEDSFSHYCELAGIKKPATMHSLRHSFATHLMESGTDIFTIKELLGHSSISSTSVYLHLANVARNNVISPADR